MANDIRILYLDDEINNLRSFKAAFRRDYSISIATDKDEAWQLIEETKPHIVFSDQRMPKVSGVDFLRSIKERYPNIIRILITGYTDVENVIDAINKGDVYRYLTKPWDEKDIRIAIENGFELYKTREDRAQKIKQLERTNKELNRFIYSTTHDLRSPISTSLGLVNLAELEIEDKDAKRYFSLIKDSLINIDDYIKNILSYYKNVKYEKNQQRTHILGAVSQVLDQLQSKIGLNDANINVDVPQSLYWVLDDFRLQIILNNLLTNALNFQRPEVKLNITVAARETQDTLTISVSDNGIGMSKDITDKIFKMFFRGTHRVSGTGLGLYIVREAVREMDGTIEVDTKPGAGTTFTLSFPKRVQ